MDLIGVRMGKYNFVCWQWSEQLVTYFGWTTVTSLSGYGNCQEAFVVHVAVL